MTTTKKIFYCSFSFCDGHRVSTTKTLFIIVLIHLLRYFTATASSSFDDTLTCTICTCFARGNEGIVDCSDLGLESIPPDIPPVLPTATALSGASNDEEDDYYNGGATLVTTTIIRLEGNAITRVPRNIFSGAPHLEEIYLHDNPFLETLDPGAFGGLERLTNLVLHHASITSLPPDLAPQSGVLERLWLHDNFIERVHGTAFRGLKGLKELTLCGNRLDHLGHGEEGGDVFENLTSLYVLSLGGRCEWYCDDDGCGIAGCG
mmetsp:Transcript_14228/g.17919  ORF Transcript_14228/g.17919 Transcript_14228/m.17919 type:complete len:262 (+) Transcript_14228:297-1082(+)